MNNISVESLQNAGKGSFVGVTNDREAHPKYWIAILVQMNTEKTVSLKLTKLGITNYVATQSEIHQWSDRRKRVEKVVIPMIVFVNIDREIENRLKTYSFVYKCISYPGMRDAAHIPDEQIDRLRFMLENADTTIEMNNDIFHIGKTVEIIRGPLKGLHGELCYYEEDKPMVGIYLEMLGYACVNVSKKDIKSKNK